MMHRSATTARFGLETRDIAGESIRFLIFIVLLLFAAQSWINYEVRAMFPFVRTPTQIIWLYPAFGMSGSWLLSIAEWLAALCVLLSFRNRGFGIAGSFASCLLFSCTLTILLFGHGDATTIGTGMSTSPKVRFVVEDFIFVGASFWLLRRDSSRPTPSRIITPDSASQNGVSGEAGARVSLQSTVPPR